MLRSVALAGALIVSASCNRTEDVETAGTAVAATAGSNTKPTGSGGSFSADLAKELGVPPGGAGGKTGEPSTAADLKSGSGGDAKAGAAMKAGEPKAGSSPAGGSAAKPGQPKAGDAKVGDAKAGDAKAGDAKAGDAKAGDAKAGDAKAGDAKAGDAKAGDAKAGDAKAGDAKAGDAKAGDAKAGDAKAGDAKAGSNATTKPAAPAAEPRIAAPVSRSVKVPGDLAAIKLSLLPNWDRDVDEAGTFQYVVRIKGTQATKTFSFRYGYEDPKAPADRDQYKKYLQDTRALTGEIKDRQRGAAWFLEGSDASGTPAFRYVVLYGGKRLICYGSLYKDADSNRLGDDRDQTLIQAKQICETLAL